MTKNTKSSDVKRAKEIDSLLVYLSLCEGKGILSLNDTYFYGLDSGINTVELDNNRNLFNQFTKNLESFDAKFVQIVEEGDFLYSFTKITELSPKYSQEYIKNELQPWKYINTTCIDILIYKIKIDGSLEEEGHLWIYRKGRRLLIPSDYSAEESKMITILLSTTVKHLWALENQWSVKIQLAKGLPSIGFYTDPIGIREILKFRDVNPERNRRDALIHWVSQHWRASRNDPSAEIFVREYLRGKQECTWHNMQVEIIVPGSNKNESKENIRHKVLRDFENSL